MVEKLWLPVSAGSPANSIKNGMFILKTPLGSKLAGAAHC